MSQDYFSPMSSKSDSKKADLLDFGFLSSSLGCESRICILTYRSIRNVFIIRYTEIVRYRVMDFKQIR